MKCKSFFNSVLLLLLIVGNTNSVLSQISMVSKKISEFRPNKDLKVELRELVNKATKCDDYNSSLVWHIGINQVENGCLLNITMQDDLIDYEYIGFFYLDNVLFVVSGVMDDSLFTTMKKKELEFKTKDKSDDIIIESPSGDYSNWIYLSTENKIMKLKEYLLPCK